MRFIKLIIFLLILTCAHSFTRAQKHNFVSYNIDEGLPQSQVINILQDADGHIWLATGGGVARFDGKKFTNYTTDDGLTENNILQIMLDHQQRIWAVTNSGLNIIRNNKIIVIPLPESLRNGRAFVTTDSVGKIWGFFNGQVYSFRETKFVKEDIRDIPQQDFSTLFKDRDGVIYLSNARKEIYKNQNGSWKPYARYDQIDSTRRIFQVYIDSFKNEWVLTSTEVFVKKFGSNELRSYFKTEISDLVFRYITFDRSGNLWIGCNKGAYKLKKDGVSDYFKYTNGFSDNWVHHIFPDQEGNVWLATEGSGLFKYTGGIFTSFDNSFGYFPSGVFAVARYDRNSVILGGNGNDFCIYDGKKLTYPLRNTEMRSIGYVYSAYTAKDGAIWIGTIGGGLWRYKNGKGARFYQEATSVFAIDGDENRILFATNKGAIAYENNSFQRIDSLEESIRSIFALNRDSIFAATSSRLYLFINHKIQDIELPDFRKTTISSFEKCDDKLFIGTLGAGIIVLNRPDRTITRITRKDGLSSDFVYSVRFDKKGQLWAGTGKGVTKIFSTDNFKTVSATNYGKEQGFTGLECNQNSIAVMDDNSVWFGAVKGAYCYHPDGDKEIPIAPQLVLQSVKLFSKPLTPGMFSDSVSRSPFYAVPQNLVLSSDNNHITFEFGAISYKNTNTRYSYFLKGLEKRFSSPDQTNFVVYPSLPPGSYTFNVRLIDETGKPFGEPLAYDFIIKPAFYQTAWFRILVALSGIAILILIYKMRKRYQERQEKLIQKLRTEEQNKIRIKTAQDFHDEMGNKLARITVLSDILKSKLPPNDESQGIAKKIQDNASLLYQGTKDIIWSLNPKNDNLYHLLVHINDFAIDLFHDTEIEFESNVVNEELKSHFLPMDYARNIMMICKEALTNILKHSRAAKATIETELVDGNMIVITIADNGKGFEKNSLEPGNGLSNIRQRADYLKAHLDIYSNDQSGTGIVLTVTIPSNGIVRTDDHK